MDGQVSRASMIRSVIRCAVWLSLLPTCVGGGRGPTSPPTNKVATSRAVRDHQRHGPVFDQASMQLDMDMWLSELEAAHPDPYTRISREAFHALVRAARSQLPEKMDPLEYFAVMQRLASALRDSHTRFHFPQDSAAFSDSFPLEIRVQDGRAFVDQPRADIARGSEIKRINGIPAAQVLDTARRLASAEVAGSPDLVGSLFVPVAWLEGVRPPFRVEGLSIAGQPIDVVLDRKIPLWEPPKRSDYRLDWLDGAVAYMSIDDMSDVTGFGPFAQKAFVQIDQKTPVGLIVDLRRNGGGSTEVADMLLDRITTKPYRITAEKHWRVSARQRAQYAGTRWATPDYLATPIGATLHYRNSPMRSPKIVTPVFRGPVCVLIGPGTGSSAMMLANAIEDYHLATLMGEPTSSPPNYFSQYLSFQLPRTLLKADVSTARFVRANGDANNRNPVIPDIFVRQSVEDWIRGEDTVLRRALTWIWTGH